MAVKIKNIIIHNLIKDVKTAAELEISKKCLSNSDSKTISLVEELNKSFSRQRFLYGIFDQNSMTNVFPNSFIRFNNKELDFETFTKLVLEDLKICVEKVPQSKGGHIIFIHYESNKLPYLAVFVVRDKQGKNFVFQDSEVIIKEVKHIDTNKMAMACRINLTSFRNNEERYLSFISPQQEEASQYFQKWIGAIKKEKDKDDSNKLKMIISKIPLPRDGNGKEMSRTDLRKMIFKHFSANKSSPIRLKALSELVWNDSEVITNFAEENNIEINEEFMGDENELKGLVKLYVSTDNIHFDCPPDYFGDKVRVNERTNPKSVVITSTAFAEELLKANA